MNHKKLPLALSLVLAFASVSYAAEGSANVAVKPTNPQLVVSQELLKQLEAVVQAKLDDSKTGKNSAVVSLVAKNAGNKNLGITNKDLDTGSGGDLYEPGTPREILAPPRPEPNTDPFEPKVERGVASFAPKNKLLGITNKDLETGSGGDLYIPGRDLTPRDPGGDPIWLSPEREACRLPRCALAKVEVGDDLTSVVFDKKPLKVEPLKSLEAKEYKNRPTLFKTSK